MGQKQSEYISRGKGDEATCADGFVVALRDQQEGETVEERGGVKRRQAAAPQHWRRTPRSRAPGKGELRSTAEDLMRVNKGEEGK